jgi:DNA-binding response OmpR family regulator
MTVEPKKILLVEDEAPLLKVLEDRFLQEGFIVFKAGDGAQGYKIAIENKPDIILLDVLLPMVNGLEMLKKIREDKAGKDIPVIMLTNLNDMQSIKQALENEAYDYLVKSDWKLDALVKKVKERVMEKN